jgi:hypothetical protein
MDKEQTQNKKLSTQNQTQQSRSITTVNPVRTHGVGIWGNPRVVMGVRVDSELKKRFKQVTKRVFGSTCNPIESFMATVVSCAESGVNFGNTIEIDKIIIERNLRERRRFVVEDVVGGDVVECSKCSVCGKDSYGAVTRRDGSRVFLCKVHFTREKKSELLGWRVL